MNHVLDGKKLAVIGDPIEHSLSPVIQQAMLDELGIACTYERILVGAGSVAAWLPIAPDLNLAGFNATMPHKTDLVPLMDSLSDDARMYRSVNTVVIREGRFHGHNTDGEGFLRSLLDAGMEYRDRRVVVYGAGGAARSVVLKLTASGAQSVTVCCRTPGKAEELASHSPRIRLCSFTEKACEAALAEAGLFINCTPLGMQGVSAQFEDFYFLDMLPPSAPVYDLIYRPLKTRLLEEAEKRGHVAVNGLGMLIHQAILALEQFSSRPLDAGLMKKAVMKRLLPVLKQGD
ncbi:shikimate dehydrogenase [Mailhella massiliensis]|uniref:Shikimate dehydrogenase (NADP(+)) n=1 Tax=Mailhella massiliensis TaxID=1903261 RepID=A0A921AX04_9BACT|nr:shikimate dehydrogenase [Mailhella massiliensis]HJD97435.1 shikimate dehydrogenase [Mailhella massiliensis]